MLPVVSGRRERRGRKRRLPKNLAVSWGDMTYLSVGVLLAVCWFGFFSGGGGGFFFPPDVF